MSVIGRDTIEVVYDGRGLPAEAERLGRETGVSQADAHNKEFDKRISEGQSRTGKKLEDEWRTIGKAEGERRAISFNQAFGDITKAKLDSVAKEVAHAFNDDGGLDAYRTKLGEIGRGYDGVGHSADSLQTKIKQLYDNKQIDYNLFRRLSTDVKTWASNAEQGEAAAASTRGALASLREELARAQTDPNTFGHLARDIDDVHLEANKANEDLDRFVNNFVDGGRHVDGFGEHVRALNADFDEQDAYLKRGSESVKGFLADLDHLPPHVRAAGTAFRDGKIGLEDLEHAIGGGVGDLEKLGGAFDGVGGKSGGAGKSMSIYTAAIVALIGLVVTLLPEMAALGSALGALTVEAGGVFGALVVGAVGFVVALKGMFGPLKDLPAAVRPAAESLQEIFGGKDFKGNSMISDLQTLLQTHVFEGLAGAIDKVSMGAFPAFRAGAISVGDALHGIISEFSTAFITEPDNLRNFQKMLVGFGPTLRELGSAAIDFGQGLTGIFAAATPFALEFTKHIHMMAEAFGDFFSSQKGQDQLVLWMTNADKIAPHLGKAFADIGQALHMMVTPDAITNTNLILDAIGNLALGLGRLGRAITPAAIGISTLLDLITRVLTDFGPTISSIFDGISSFLVGTVKVLTPIVDFIANSVINPISKVIGAFLGYLGTALGVASGNVKGTFGGLGAAIQPVVDLISNGLVNAFKIMGEVITVAKPVVDGMGTVMLALGRGVGSIIGAFFDAGSSILDFKGKSNDLESFIHGPLADAFVVLGGKLQEFAGWITNTAVPYIKGQLIPAFEDFWRNIQENVIPAFADMLPHLSDFAGFLTNQVIPALSKIDFGKLLNGLIILGTDLVAMVDIFGQVVSAMGAFDLAAFRWGQVVVNAVGIILVAIGGLGEAFLHLATGDFVGAQKVATDAFNGIGSLSKDLAHTFGVAMSDTGKAASTFGTAVNNVGRDVQTMVTAGKSAFNSLSAAGKADLNTLATNLNLTGSQARTFEEVVALAAGGSKTKLAGLANDRSLAEVEQTLGLTGNAARAFESKVAAAMSGASGSTDSTKGHVSDLHTSISQLPGGKTIIFHEEGAQQATDAAEILKRSVDALHDKTIHISASYDPGKSFYGNGADPFAATGGLMLGYGTGVTRGVKFMAAGGILNSATFLSGGSVVAGEAGPEAIVPLSGPLNRVDPSVRELAAIARGLTPFATASGSSSSGAYVAPGAVQVITNNANAGQVAAAVLDRLVPQL